MIEGTEEKFAGYMSRTLDALVKIVEDDKADAEVRIKAACVIDGANDTFLKSQAFAQFTKAHEDHSKGLLDQVKDLKRGKKQPWEDDED